MSLIGTIDWQTANQQRLMAELARVRARVEAAVAPPSPTPSPIKGEGAMEAEPCTPLPAMGEGSGVRVISALDTLVARFGLSPFERDVLLLCAGIELESSFAALIARANGDPARPFPTWSLALAALDEPHWSALAPDAPLRRWRLIDMEIDSRLPLTLRPLRIDERVLHYLAGVDHLDERLAGLIAPVVQPFTLAPAHATLAREIAAAWRDSGDGRRPPLIHLCGDQPATRRAIAAAACAQLEVGLCELATEALPTAPGDIAALSRLWEREAALSHCALLIDSHESVDESREAALRRLIVQLDAPVIVGGRDRQRLTRPAISFDVPPLATHEQRALWQAALGPVAHTLNGQLDAIVSHFRLDSAAIGRIVETGSRGPGAGRPEDPETRRPGDTRSIWEACRREARVALDALAQRIESSVAWDDLVLPEAELRTLHEIAAQARQRARVYEAWGFGARYARGLGITALFAGASGTGKTLAAEVIASELRLDLYRIDLAGVVSKYIGETEKNLRRVFEAAEGSGAILLFDEADALFGKRSEVKDSHDRYANIEVSYLLQRMEAYRGLAILTTNLKSALDPAFLRRLRFVVNFPFPDLEQRAAIWRRSFPADAPTEDLAIDRLARLNVAGGSIRNIALHAAFLAADANEPIRMAHLLRAARTECAKLERPLTSGEIAGWVDE